MLDLSQAEVDDLRLNADQCILTGSNVMVDPRVIHFLLDCLSRMDSLEIECGDLERRLYELKGDYDV